MNLYAQAEMYLNAGLSIIPIKTDGSKSPALSSWKRYQNCLPNRKLLNSWFKEPKGIAFVCGKVSGNLEAIDFDEPGLYEQFEALGKEEGLLDLLMRLPLEETPKDGRHLLYRCETSVQRNLKLAMDFDTKKKQLKTLIETRGEGGCIIVSPTPAQCHPAKRPYRLLRGDLSQIPIITAQEREALLSLARSFNRYVKSSRIVTEKQPTNGEANRGISPWDDFNQRADWTSLLERHAWRQVSQRDSVVYWKRPGKEEPGISATTNYASKDLLYVFSTNAHPFEHERAYNKFMAYTLLEHNGDFKAATKAVVKEGYGKQATKNAQSKEKAGEWLVLDGIRFKRPLGYLINDRGIIKVTFSSKGEPKSEVVSHQPVLITGQAINIDEKTIKLDLIFKRNETWEKIQVNRQTISDSRQIVTLSDHGVPVHIGNAKKLIEYLHAFENANLPELDTVYLTHSNGWKEFNKTRVFGLGDTIFGLGESKAKVAFMPEPGFERFTNALQKHGSLERWKSYINLIQPYPNAMMALYAAFVSPLLSLLDAPNFIVHYGGDSSMGKTTAIEIAASVWGNPAKEAGGLVTSWNNTQVFVERIATFFKDLPCFLDDSHLANEKIVSKVLYMVANGVGRGRGAKQGIQQLASWHTNAFSTGEKPVTDSTQYDGAKARVIEKYGTPFERHQKSLVNAVKEGIREHYGLAGPVFIEYLLSILRESQGIAELKSRYRQYRNKLSAKASTEIGDRCAHYFASIWVAAELVEGCLELGGNPEEIITQTFEESLSDRLQEGDMATRALQEVISFAQANEKSFMGKEDAHVKEYFGIWRKAEYIAFYPHKLREFLGRSGFSYSSVLRSWAERGWIKNKPGHLTTTVWQGKKGYRMICILWPTIAMIINN